MTNYNVEGREWEVREDHHSPFVRTLAATPVEPLEVTYETETYVNGRPADASFIADVVKVSIRHMWDDSKQAWWSTGGLHLRIVDPDTGRRYHKTWKANQIDPGWANDGVASSASIIDPLLAATHPKTVITVIETKENQ